MLSKSDQGMMADARWQAYFSRQNADIARAKAGRARNKASRAACEPGQPVVPNHPGGSFPSMSWYFPSSLDGRRVVLTRAELEIRSRRARQREFSAYAYEGMAEARERAARKDDPTPLYSPTDRHPVTVAPVREERAVVVPRYVADNYRAAAQAWQAAAREWAAAASIWWPAT